VALLEQIQSIGIFIIVLLSLKTTSMHLVTS
jgi:hypothetical protein